MYNHYVKRFIDILISFVLILILLPLYLPICIILLLTGEHKILYLQKRIGYHNKPFTIYKFTTMYKGSEKIGNGLHTIRNDPRVLPFGKILRKTKINELPQLINILKGDMSFVGPRPLVNNTFTPYPKHIKNNIYNIKPGLTGIGSIIFRDEEKLLSETKLPKQYYYKNYISPYKGELELWYQQHQSIYTDIILIFLTMLRLFLPTNNLIYCIFKSIPSKNEILNKL